MRWWSAQSTTQAHGPNTSQWSTEAQGRPIPTARVIAVASVKTLLSAMTGSAYNDRSVSARQGMSFSM